MMKQEDTKQRILDKALELFSARGYDAVSVGEIAEAVGIRAPSLYNHFPGKQAIFDAIVESTAAQYEADTGRLNIHVQSASRDIPVFAEITEDALYEKVRQIFAYSLHNEQISRFRRMMTIEQFRSPELAALYSGR
ncbi:MAG: helix-turn-helix domain-containing protein [Oscillospiraceae bacterium]|nr:helix-turn-helix domain-containing protein [Oscillospiraceae bacterium]